MLWPASDPSTYGDTVYDSLMGFCGLLKAAAEEESALNEPEPDVPEEVLALRKELAPIEIALHPALRFLKKAKGDVGKAAKLYREMLEWRKQEQLDEEVILSDAQRLALDTYYCPYVLEGTDLLGRPVMLTTMGALEIKPLEEAGVTERMMRRQHAKSMDKLIALIDASANPELGHLLIIDIGTATVSKFWATQHILRDVHQIGDTYFPETLGKIVIVRASPLVNTVMHAVNAFLDEDTRAKIEFASGDPDETLRGLLPPTTRIPADSGIGPWPRPGTGSGA